MKKFSTLIVAALTSLGVHAQNGLFARYLLDGNGNDSLVNYNMTPSGILPATTNRNGTAGGATNFDGSSFFYHTFTSVPANIPQNAFTVAAWVRPTGSQSYSTVVGVRYNALNDPYNTIWLGIDGPSQKWAGAVSTTSASDNMTIGTDIALNTWTHLALVFDGSSIRLVINGTPMKTLSVTGNVSFNMADAPTLCIGNTTTASSGYGQPGGHKFIGDIDDVYIYNRALSNSEIQTMAGTTVDINSNLLTYFGFCNDATDLSGSNNDGTVNGSVPFVTGQDGTANSAMYFNGTANYVSLPNGKYFDGGNFTVSSWVKVNSVVNDGAYFGFADAASGQSAGRVDGGLSYGTGGSYISIGFNTYNASTPLPVGKWAHLVWVYENGTLTCYIDKKVDATISNVAAPANIMRTNNTLGRSSYPNGGDFSMDEFAIYNRALTATEVEALYSFTNCTTVKNDAILATEISVSPNPAQGRVSIEAAHATIERVEVLSLAGAVLSSTTANTIDMSGFAAGFYLVRVSTNKGTVTQRLIKQ